MKRSRRLLQVIFIFLTAVIAEGSPLSGKLRRAVNPENGGLTIGGLQGTPPTLVIDRTGLVGQAVQAVGESVKSKGVCAICVLAVTHTINEVRRGVSEEGVRETLTSYCKMSGLATPPVCDGVIALYTPEVVHIANRTTLSPVEICSFGLTKECGSEFDDNHDWSVPIPGGKPPTVLVEPSADGRRLKVLHISDTHLDPYYAPGSLASCALPLCCRLTSAPAETGRKHRSAGPWGDYGNCDAPEKLLRSGLEHASREHPDIDYILWTGDILPHDIWNQTREESLSTIRKTMQLFKEYFPRTPIFPAIGNHEAVPVNSFSPSDADERFSMAWLYNELAQQWPQLTPSLGGNVTELVRKGAFYSVLAGSNLRIISVNTNFCNDKNWWLLLNNEDPEKELIWLINELKAAEEKGEKVHIIGHIPPGSAECRAAWSRNFDLIVNRFETTIKALFYGHTHNDEFELFFDRTNPSSLRPVAIAYLAPSITPFGGGNPAYRIYSIDGEHPDTTWTVIDHDTWWMDLQAANQGYSPIWRRLYNARREYNLQSLSPSAWANLVRTMATDDKVFDTYYKFYQRDSPRREKCDTPCRRRMLCDLLSGRSRDTSTCQSFLPVEESRPVVVSPMSTNDDQTSSTTASSKATEYNENDEANEVILLGSTAPSNGHYCHPVGWLLATIVAFSLS